MKSLTRALALAGVTLGAVGVLAGCSSTKDEPPVTTAPSATTPSSATSTVLSPTEKALTPGGDNSFSPTINPTQPGGNCTRVVNGVCMR